MPDDLFPSAVRLSRQGGPSGFWLLGVERELSGLPGGRERVNVRLTAAQMSELVSTWQAITEPPPVLPRISHNPPEYHVDVLGPVGGWWTYTITGFGLLEPSRPWRGLPRRSRAAALRAAQARVDRLARADRPRLPVEHRDIHPRCVP